MSPELKGDSPDRAKMSRLNFAFSERCRTDDNYRRLLPWAELFNASAVLLLLCIAASPASAQTRDYPKEIRGYKVERAVVEVKRSDAKEIKSGDKSQTPQQTSANANEQTDNQTRSDPDTLIQLGKPQLARITPLGVTVEVPIVVAPVKRSVCYERRFPSKHNEGESTKC